MKHLAKVLIVLVLLPVWVFSQAPQKMSYQAVIRNSSNQLVATQAVGMRISILQGSETGTAVYKETHATTTNANGLVSLEIGGGTPETGVFADIDWSDGPYYIKTETDPEGGTNYTISGTSQILSVPYAMFAKTAGDHYIGEIYGGGIIVAVWKISGTEHGLIASLTDLDSGSGIIWTTANYQSTLVPGGALDQFDGFANSNAIVAQAGSDITYAAGLCRAYSATGDGGLNDWYLPAAWELEQCYNAIFVVNTILGKPDRFRLGFYWSSTEATGSSAYYQNFDYNYPGGYDAKSTSKRIRAFRRF